LWYETGLPNPGAFAGLVSLAFCAAYSAVFRTWVSFLRDLGLYNMLSAIVHAVGGVWAGCAVEWLRRGQRCVVREVDGVDGRRKDLELLQGVLETVSKYIRLVAYAGLRTTRTVADREPHRGSLLSRPVTVLLLVVRLRSRSEHRVPANSLVRI
jgi:hypothetical protein